MEESSGWTIICAGEAFQRTPIEYFADRCPRPLLQSQRPHRSKELAFENIHDNNACRQNRKHDYRYWDIQPVHSILLSAFQDGANGTVQTGQVSLLVGVWWGDLNERDESNHNVISSRFGRPRERKVELQAQFRGRLPCPGFAAVGLALHDTTPDRLQLGLGSAVR